MAQGLHTTAGSAAYVLDEAYFTPRERETMGSRLSKKISHRYRGSSKQIKAQETVISDGLTGAQYPLNISVRPKKRLKSKSNERDSPRKTGKTQEPQGVPDPDSLPQE